MVRPMFNLTLAAEISQLVLRENQVGAGRGVLIRQSVANEDRGATAAIEQAHHRGFAGFATMPARLMERREINQPAIRMGLQAARKNSHAIQMSSQIQ